MPEPKKRKRVRNQTPNPGVEASMDGDSGGPPPVPEEGVGATTAELVLPDLELVETGVFTGGDDQERVVEQANGTGVAGLLQDQQFIDQIISGMVGNRTLESLSDDLADKLSDELEASPEFRSRLIDAFMASDPARGRFVKAMIEGFS